MRSARTAAITRGLEEVAGEDLEDLEEASSKREVLRKSAVTLKASKELLGSPSKKQTIR